MEEEYIRLVETLELEIRKVMATIKDEYGYGVVDGLIKAIKILES